ncbi:MAG: hypothetical protein ACFFD4_05385 [Candidatus Odinarchaeota archaeon]
MSLPPVKNQIITIIGLLLIILGAVSVIVGAGVFPALYGSEPGDEVGLGTGEGIIYVVFGISLIIAGVVLLRKYVMWRSSLVPYDTEVPKTCPECRIIALNVLMSFFFQETF